MGRYESLLKRDRSINKHASKFCLCIIRVQGSGFPSAFLLKCAMNEERKSPFNRL